MREKELECKLAKAVRDSGGLALKFISPGLNGVPDRLLLFMGGKADFCGSEGTRAKAQAAAGASDGTAAETGIQSVCC